MSSQDVEALATGQTTQRRKRSPLRLLKSKSMSSTSTVPIGTKPVSAAKTPAKSKYEAEFSLVTRASILRNAVESGDEKLASAMLSRLKERKLEKTIQDVSGNGLLQIAVLKGNVGMTKLLLSQGFSINGVDNNHGTALNAAIYMDHKDVINYLLDYKDEKTDAGVNVNTQGGYYGCALQCAAFKASPDLISRLLALQADVKIYGGKYGSVLAAAARTGILEVVNLILSHLNQEDVNFEGGVWGTALQAAAKGPYTSSTKYLRHLSRGRVLRQATGVLRSTWAPASANYVAVAEELIKKGARVNTYGGKLESPINAAATSGNLKMVELLIKNDESPHAEHSQAYSRALISAISQEIEKKDRLAMCKLLIAKGADAKFEAGSGLHNRPLTAAAAVNEKSVVEYLLEKADSETDRKEQIDFPSGIYGTALRAALSASAKDTAEYLIRKGADLKNGDEAYGNVLHIAAFSDMNDIVELLLQKGVDVNIRDDCGQTALHVAAYLGLAKIVETLLKRENIQIDIKDAWGDTPLKIVETVMERGSHPGPSLEEMRRLKQLLFKASIKAPKPIFGVPLQGPPIVIKPPAATPDDSRARAVYASPIWNPGLGFQATIVDFLEKNGDEYFYTKELSVDDLLYRKESIEETMDLNGREGIEEKMDLESYKKNLRWIHIPANNMTWAEMLLKILWAKYKYTKDTSSTCKSYWGTDPFYVSPDLAPHARFVTPQCERLVPDIHVEQDKESEAATEPNTMFLAMPYIHWESYRAQEAVCEILEDIKEQSLKSRITRGSKSWRTSPNYSQTPAPGIQRTNDFPPSGSNVQLTAGTNLKVVDNDDELLRKYLFKRWPIHVRRTLDQYYFSYLADTRARDRDQVVMRARNLELRRTKIAATRMFGTSARNIPNTDVPENDTSPPQNRKSKTSKKPSPAAEDERKPPPDDDSPVVMIDQLWLWYLGKDVIVTSFPRRRLDKDDGDLDTDDKTDVLETVLAYLQSAKRNPIRNSYDLTELIISQCVGILHRADVIPDLDFLKIFGSRANWAVDTVMTSLTEFVEAYEKFMKELKDNEKSEEYGRHYNREFEKIFSVTKETLLLREIQDIKDELTMLKAVFSDQGMVLTKAGDEIAKERKVSASNRTSMFSFEQQSGKHARHIERMHVQASQAYKNLKDLLDLKQQQANVLEARVSRKQAIATTQQGKTVMVFTIVTIIFLPLTFMTTIFQLPILEYPRYNVNTLEPDPTGLLHSNYVFGFIIFITTVLAVPFIVIAFMIRRIEHSWDGWREWRRNVIPLHWERDADQPAKVDEGDPTDSHDVDGIQDEDSPGEEAEAQEPLWKIGRIYWGGPQPKRRKTAGSGEHLSPQ